MEDYFPAMKKLCAILALASVTACVTPSSDSPIVDNGPAAAEGSLVALDRPVTVGNVVATPKSVVEDSRCPENARCVWAGRLTVETRIDGPGWRETAPLTLGETATVHGVRIALVSGIPEKQAERDTPPAEYRFAYEARE